MCENWKRALVTGAFSVSGVFNREFLIGKKLLKMMNLRCGLCVFVILMMEVL